MQRIEVSFLTFAENLERQFPLVAGSWSTQSSTMQKIYHLLLDTYRLVNAATTFCNLLDKVEKTPVVFDPSAVESQKLYYAGCLKGAKALKKMLKESQSKQVEPSLALLAQKVVALKYRIEAIHGGLNRSAVDPSLKEQLMTAALAWKGRQRLMKDKTLTERDIGKIEEACAYRKFAKLLLLNKNLQDMFFSWALLYNSGVRQFVEFPSTSASIKSCYLAARVGRFGGQMFAFEKRVNPDNGTLEKVVSLPFHINGEKIEYVSILDESKEIKLYKGWQLSIKKIIDIFASKNKEIGDLEFFESTGITVWNSHKLGRWNHETKSYDLADLTASDWVEKFPVLQRVTRKELENKYKVSLAPHEWLVCGKSTRETPDLDLAGQHGFLELAIPDKEDPDTYRVYPFGCFAVKFPNTAWELLKFLGATIRAAVAYPDENFFYAHRQHAAYPIPLTPDEGQDLLRRIQFDLIRARFGHLVFQFASENCAYWAQSVLDSINKPIPALYKIPAVQSEPKHFFLGSVFYMIKRVPDSMRPLLFKGLDLCLASWRGVTIIENGQRVHKSHLRSESRKHLVVYQPGRLHQQIEKGELKGVIFTGH